MVNRASITGRGRQWIIALQSIGAAVVAYVAAGISELGFIRTFQPSERELAWVSDVVLATAFGVAVYLWRHLSATRLALASRERAELILDTELAIAADMQRRLLPDLPPAGGGVTWAALLRPAGRIGGDFYDIVALGPGRWMVLVADVSGKGIPAAMALSTVRAGFRAFARDPNGPAQVLSRVSSMLHDQWAGAPYMTAIVARVELDAGRLTYSNAGHPSGIVTGSSGLRTLGALGPPAALLAGVAYDERTIAIRPGDVCLLVSDGVTEAINDPSPDAIARLAHRALAHDKSATVVCDAVMAEALKGTGPQGVADWQDDRTILVLSIDDEPAAKPGSHAPGGGATRRYQASTTVLPERNRRSGTTGASDSTAPATLRAAKPACSSIQPDPMLANAPPPQMSASPSPWTRTRSAGATLSVSSALPPTKPRFQPTPSRKRAMSVRG